MMKKILLFLVAVCFGFNAYCESVVLSDTSVDDDIVTEESLDTNNHSSSDTQSTFQSILAKDTTNPLFLTADDHFMSDTYVYFVDKKLRAGQYLDYGINKNLVLHANLLYQWDFSGHHENGFSATEFGGVYRMNHGDSGSRIISDALFGLKLWGSSHVRTPEYADSSYYAGLRFGRNFVGVTLAGTIKSTWVFDEDRGLSYLNFIPEAYFRFKYDWRAGVGLDFCKSTNTHLLDDQEWLNLKLVKQYGNTQYVGHFDYEFEANEVQAGFDVKILF
jgi:hypothetical protein